MITNSLRGKKNEEGIDKWGKVTNYTIRKDILKRYLKMKFNNPQSDAGRYFI